MSSVRWTKEQYEAYIAKGDSAAPGVVHIKAPPKDRPARSKYGNEKTDGYASKFEAKRSQELKAREAAGLISELREQVPFELVPTLYVDGKLVERACSYVADFVYVENGARVVEDVKGFATKEYILKRKLMLYLHGISIREVRRGKRKAQCA